MFFSISTRVKILRYFCSGTYENGTLKEVNSWDDFQKLDHLEYQRDQLLHLTEESYWRNSNVK